MLVSLLRVCNPTMRQNVRATSRSATREVTQQGSGRALLPAATAASISFCSFSWRLACSSALIFPCAADGHFQSLEPTQHPMSASGLPHRRPLALYSTYATSA